MTVIMDIFYDELFVSCHILYNHDLWIVTDIVHLGVCCATAPHRSDEI